MQHLIFYDIIFLLQAEPAFLLKYIFYNRMLVEDSQLKLNSKINVAIDGPAGAGKSTIARLVANKLGYIYFDTGAMYRAVTWMTINKGLKLEAEDAIIAMAESLDIQLKPGQSNQQVYVNGTNITDHIRSIQVNQLVSKIAQIEEVRKLLVFKQKQMASGKGAVMDGRDIGTHVLPDAELKIYLTASVEERARRRYKEMDDSTLTMKQLQQEIFERDETDKKRSVSPLIVAEGAVVLDCTHMSIDEVVERILELCRTKLTGEQ